MQSERWQLSSVPALWPERRLRLWWGDGTSLVPGVGALAEDLEAKRDGVSTQKEKLGCAEDKEPEDEDWCASSRIRRRDSWCGFNLEIVASFLTSRPSFWIVSLDRCANGSHTLICHPLIGKLFESLSLVWLLEKGTYEDTRGWKQERVSINFAARATLTIFKQLEKANFL